MASGKMEFRTVLGEKVDAEVAECSLEVQGLIYFLSSLGAKEESCLYLTSDAPSHGRIWAAERKSPQQGNDFKSVDSYVKAPTFSAPRFPHM